MIRPTIMALTLAVAAASAQAHSKTDATTPADGATVAEVPMVHVAFGGPMRITFAELRRDGDAVAITRAGGLDPVAELHATPDEALAPGTYRFEWRGLSGDGHTMEGELGFTVAE